MANEKRKMSQTEQQSAMPPAGEGDTANSGNALSPPAPLATSAAVFTPAPATAAPAAAVKTRSDRQKFQELQQTTTNGATHPQHYQHYIDGEGNSIADDDSDSDTDTPSDSNRVGDAVVNTGGANGPSDAVGEELIQWLDASGAETTKLQLQQYAPEVRGVHSQKVLVPGERILVIPKKCLITVEMGKRTEIGQKLLARNLDFVAPKHIFLMMFLLTDMEDVRIYL